MSYSNNTLQKYLVQVRRIAEHREKDAEKKIAKIYNKLSKDLQHFVGEEYVKYAENDVLTQAILQQKGEYARFLEEVEKRINISVPLAAKSVKQTVEEVYRICYEGIVKGVQKSVTNKDLQNNLKGLKGCTPEMAKRAVENPINGLTLNKTLEKNRKDIIYNIKKEITTGLNQGDRYSTVARRLTDKVNMSYGKAMRIVRTETHRVTEGGIHDASNNVDEILIKNSKYGLRMVKTWRNMGDGAVRPQRRKIGGIRKKTNTKTYKKKKVKGILIGGVPNHVVMDKQTVLQNEMFDLGDGVKAIAPGHSGVAGHDCNCRCFIVEELMNEDEFFKATGRKFDDNDFTNNEEISPKMSIIHEPSREYTTKEIKDIAEETDKIASKYTNIESKWSGNIVINNEEEKYGKAWNCDIITTTYTSPHIMLHEQLHARSISYFDKKTYHKYENIEESSVQFLAQEISKIENIEILDSYYDDMTNALRKINSKLKIRDNDFIFAKDLFEIPVNKRLDWLEDVVYNGIKATENMTITDSEKIWEYMKLLY